MGASAGAEGRGESLKNGPFFRQRAENLAHTVPLVQSVSGDFSSVEIKLFRGYTFWLVL